MKCWYRAPRDDSKVNRNVRFFDQKMKSKRQGIPIFVFLFLSVAMATSQVAPSRPTRTRPLTGSALATGTAGTREGGGAAGTRTSTPARKLTAELSRVEHQKLTTQRTGITPHRMPDSRGTGTAPAIHYKFRNSTQRGVVNNLGNGSGSMHSGAGRRISEKRR